MKKAISSIAWSNNEHEIIGQTLANLGFKYIEAAPNLFPYPLSEIDETAATQVREFWNGYGIKIMAMQALLFGQPDLKLFADNKPMLTYLKHVISMASHLHKDIPEPMPLIFGSPKNRLKGNLTTEQAHEIAVKFFRTLSDFAYEHNCIICIEANAKEYACDFILNHTQAYNLVKLVDHKACKMNIDTGVMQLNNETIDNIKNILSEIVHIHISQPYLNTLSDMSINFHSDFMNLLLETNYNKTISIEMKQDNDNINNIKNSINKFNYVYK